MSGSVIEFRPSAAAGAGARLTRARQEILEMLTISEDSAFVCAQVLRILSRSLRGIACALLETRNGGLSTLASEGLEESDLTQLAEVLPGEANAAGDDGAPIGAGSDEAIFFHPLISGAGELLGSLAVVTRHRPPLNEDERAVIATAVRVAAIVIEQARLIGDLKHQYLHDGLTGLANRAHHEDRLIQELSRAAARGTKAGVIRLDLDRFEAMNDLLGSRLADLLLERVARRLTAAAGDRAWFARIGGDEFGAVAGGLREAQEAFDLARRIHESMNEPLHLAGHELLLTASIGVAVYPDDATEAPALERAAEDALRHAKRRGRNQVARYEPSMDRQHRERARLESRLHLALRNEEFLLHYQPQLSVRSGSVESVEALLRWKNPEVGLVSPAAFIPVAEASGLIAAIGRWVLETACRQAKGWQRMHGMPRRVAVNVSALQLAETGFPAIVESALEASGLAPDQLELELTESAMADDGESVLRQLERLKSIGVRLSLDDFGTGYSSLGYLQRLPIDTLKIDRSFVADLKHSRDEATLLRNIVRLAQSLRKQIVVEGVETADQAVALVEMGCEILQGYHVARPMPLAQLLAMAWL